MNLILDGRNLKGYTMEDTQGTTYKDEFGKLLESYWSYLTYPGDEIQLPDGSNAVTVQRNELGESRWTKHVEIITELPNNQFVAWDFEEGLTEYQDSMGPDEMGVELEDRVKKTETITVTKYVKED